MGDVAESPIDVAHAAAVSQSAVDLAGLHQRLATAGGVASSDAGGEGHRQPVVVQSIGDLGGLSLFALEVQRDFVVGLGSHQVSLPPGDAPRSLDGLGAP